MCLTFYRSDVNWCNTKKNDTHQLPKFLLMWPKHSSYRKEVSFPFSWTAPNFSWWFFPMAWSCGFRCESFQTMFVFFAKSVKVVAVLVLIDERVLSCVVGVVCCPRCCPSCAALYTAARNGQPENGLGFGASLMVRRKRISTIGAARTCLDSMSNDRMSPIL